MFTIFIALLAIVFHFAPGSATSPSPFSSPRSSLVSRELEVPDPSDCYEAINMIPSGEFLVNGDSTTDAHGVTKLKIHFPPNSTTRKFYMPAIFRSGICMVKVVADVSPW